MVLFESLTPLTVEFETVIVNQELAFGVEEASELHFIIIIIIDVGECEFLVSIKSPPDGPRGLSPVQRVDSLGRIFHVDGIRFHLCVNLENPSGQVNFDPVGPDLKFPLSFFFPSKLSMVQGPNKVPSN